MNIFIIGLPNSGRTTVAKALAQTEGAYYIDASSWLKNSFRKPNENEPEQKFQDEYFHFLSSKLIQNPNLVSNHVNRLISEAIISNLNNETFIIDGLYSPRDLVHLFNSNEDYIVFLNRTDNETEYKDHESIGVSVIRDYCYWLSSANLLSKERWLEFNYKIPGEDSDFIKTLGSKNTVMIIKSISKVISILKEKLKI
jgi:adenylate kinase family enzyme